MATFRRLGDRLLTVAAFLAIPVMLLALGRAGSDGKERMQEWTQQRGRRALVDSIAIGTERRVVLGGASAKHTFVELMDYQCPACRVADSLLQLGMRDGSDTRIIAIHFPLTTIHPFAASAAIASVCAERQGRLREFHHAIYLQHVPEQADKMWRLAHDVGVADSARFASCVASKEAAQIVRRDAELAPRLGALGTPTFIGEDGSDVPLSVVLERIGARSP